MFLLKQAPSRLPIKNIDYSLILISPGTLMSQTLRVLIPCTLLLQLLVLYMHNITAAVLHCSYCTVQFRIPDISLHYYSFLSSVMCIQCIHVYSALLMYWLNCSACNSVRSVLGTGRLLEHYTNLISMCIVHTIRSKNVLRRYSKKTVLPHIFLQKWKKYGKSRTVGRQLCLKHPVNKFFIV